VVADQLSALTKLTDGSLTRFLPVCSLNKPYRTSVVPGLHLSDNRVYQELGGRGFWATVGIGETEN